jgi:hypothetical protein
MCGKSFPRELELVSGDVVAAEIASNRTTVCGRCERLVENARGPAAPASSNSQQLSPEQRTIKKWLEVERARRKKAQRHAEEEKERRAEEGRSTSVRAVSGGLPTLGKRH